jgi:N-acetylglutamate synthase-like GNAT family acetyltransferase
VNIRVYSAGEVSERASVFYARNGRDGGFSAGDTLIVAEEGGEWIGAARLCLEHGHYLLRTMQVESARQGESIGSQILKHFISLVKERGVREVHLIAFDHLERFYGQIGFVKVQAAPEFLLERLSAVANKSPDKKHILMKWGGGGR